MQHKRSLFKSFKLVGASKSLVAGMELNWSPYRDIERYGYRLIETIGNYVDIFISENFKEHIYLILPIDWPMGVLFRSKRNYRSFIPNDLLEFSRFTKTEILIREPESLKVVGKAKARFLIDNVIEVYEINGDIKNYYLSDLIRNPWRALIRKLLSKAMGKKYMSIYALRAEVNHSIDLLKQNIVPGPFSLALPCIDNNVIERYRILKKRLRGFASPLCINLSLDQLDFSKRV